MYPDPNPNPHRYRGLKEMVGIYHLDMGRRNMDHYGRLGRDQGRKPTRRIRHRIQ